MKPREIICPTCNESTVVGYFQEAGECGKCGGKWHTVVEMVPRIVAGPLRRIGDEKSEAKKTA
jgi:hypothetical protein